MGHAATPAYETAQSRISALISEIGGQLDEINCTNCVDSVIAEQEKSDFIKKQTDIIFNYRFRDEHDTRDSYIAELEEKLAAAEKRSKADCERWLKECQQNRHLREALSSLTTVLVED